MKQVVLRLRIFIIVLISVLVVGTLGFMALEKLSASDSFYFTVVTISTVGYGDINPTTTGAKILSLVLIIAGVSSFTGFIINGTQLLVERKQERLRNERLNMLAGVFFSEFGSELLHTMSSFDKEINKYRSELIVDKDWTDSDFQDLVIKLKKHKYNIDITKPQLLELSYLLSQKGDLLLRLFENPHMVEHINFTELLRAALHLKDELMLRSDLSELPQKDMDHLVKDVARVYILLAEEWVSHMRYLKDSFPYMFSLALRTNPFYRNPSPLVR